MKTSKWTAAAVVLALLAGGVILLEKSAPSAFGIEDILAACRSVRTVHVKAYANTNAEPNEFWIKTDEQGNVLQARYYLPETEDGAKLVTWTTNKCEVWFKTKKRFLTAYGPEAQGWLQSYINITQPEAIMRNLTAAQKTHQAIVDVQKDRINVTYKAKHSRRVFYIDEQTRLIRRIETFNTTKTGEETPGEVTEFSDYNVPIDDSMFSLREQLPDDVKVADTLNQVTGVEQVPGVTDPQAAAETARQFFQAMIDKDYQTVGSIWGGERQSDAKKEFGNINVTGIVAIGEAVPQTNWVPRGYQVPCELEVTHADGAKTVWKSSPYVRPGDNRQYPNNWHITGGVNPGESNLKPLPAKYQNLTPRQAAEIIFNACASNNWDELLAFWPGGPDDPKLERFKDYMGGLKVITLGEAFQEAKYPGWYVPYEIQIKPVEVFLLVANTNGAHRYVAIGFFDKNLHPDDLWEWTSPPETLPDDDPCLSMTPEQITSAYFTAMSRLDWTQMGKVTSDADVAKTQKQLAEAKKAGLDVQASWPHFDVIGVADASNPSTVYVKCRVTSGPKKWRLAIRNDNPEKRFLFDGGL